MMKPTTIGACCIAALLPFSIHATPAELMALAPSIALLNADGSHDH